jgi:phage protein D
MTPIFELTANGQDLTGKIKSRLIGLTISDEIGTASDSLEIELDNRSSAIAVPRFGAELRLGLGYAESGIVAKGVWRVDEVEMSGPDRKFLIRARSADTNTATALPKLMAKKDHTWLDGSGNPLTIGAIAAAMADENGLKLQIDPTVASAIPGNSHQTAESDLTFLGNAAADVDAFVKPAGGKLLVLKFGAGISSSGQALPTITINITDALRWRCLLTRRSSHAKVKAHWTDPNGLTHEETAESGDSSMEDSETLLEENYHEGATAQNAAQSKANQLARGSESVSVSMVGDPRICSEMRIILKGFHPDIDRTWLAARVMHRLNESGLVTEIECTKVI